MGFQRYASFTVLASAIADATGALPADVLRVGGLGTAFIKNAHRHEFVYDPKPGYLYVRSRAISSRTNDNFDTFPAHAIKESWRTFVGKPVFVNHNNDDHKRSRGVITDAALHEDVSADGSPDTWVEVLMEVDAIKFPKLAEAVVKGHIDRTSMGTEVALSTCSYCGNAAANPAEYCRHIPAMKGQRITRTTASGSKESVLISEICEGLSFFENSLLVEAPADPTAYVFGVDARGLSKSASTRSASLHAVARETNNEHPPRLCSKGCKRPAAPGTDLCHWHRYEKEYERVPESERFLASLTDDEISEAESILDTASTGGQMSQRTAAEDPEIRVRKTDDYQWEVKDQRTGVVLGWLDHTNPDEGWWTTTPDHEEIEYPSRAKAMAGLLARRGKTSSRRTALGEQTAPAQVDTLRVEACPVCADADSFNGTKCNVCGFIKPPDLFDDPDLERAKKVDLRGGDATGEADPTTPSSELECDSCGEVFPLAGKPKPKPGTPGLTSTSALPNAVPKPKPTAPDNGNPFAKKDKPKKKPVDPNTQADDPNVDPNADPAPDPESPEEPAEQDPKAPQSAPPKPEQDQVDPNADPEQEDPAQPADPNAPPEADGGTDQLVAGDACPSCGAGTLNEIPIATAPEVVPSAGAPDAGDAAQAVAPQPVDPNEVDPQQDPNADPNVEPPKAVDPNADPGVGEMDPNQPTDPKDEAVQPDQGKAPAAPAEEDDSDEDEPDEEGDKDSDGKKKNLPPWMKKKTSQRARLQSKGTVDTMANPAQRNRNRLIEALRTQQAQIQAQANANALNTRALLTLSQAAGVGGHPHFAALRKMAADDKSVATTDDAALASDAKDDPESIGASPSSANTGVTPDATTDVSNTNVALPTDAFNNMIDVTGPTSGIDVPKGDAAHVDTDVKIGNPSQEPFPNNSGWKGASVEDQQVRLMTSLRLAKLRKAAGIGGDVDEMSLGQAIHDNQNFSLAVLQHEINTLAAISAAKSPTARTATARSLVPQRAAEVQRTVPSLTAQASTTTQTDVTTGPLADSLF